MELSDGKRFELKLLSPALGDYYIDYDIRLDSGLLEPSAMELSGRRVEVFFDGCRIIDDYGIDDSVLRVSRRWIIEREGAWFLSVKLGVRIIEPEFFIPAVLYRGNDKGTGCFPRGESAAFWGYSEERTPLPCCLMIHNSRHNHTYFTEPSARQEYRAVRSAGLNPDSVVIETTVSGTENPRRYAGKKKLLRTSSGPENNSGIRLSGGDLPFEHESKFTIVRQEGCRSMFSAYRKVLEKSLETAGEDRADGYASWREYLERKTADLEALTVYDDDSGLGYLRMGRNNGELQDIYEYTAASFLVKSLEGAWIFSELAKRTGRSEYLKYAEGIGRFFLKGESLPGVHQDCHDLKTGEWGGYLGISENDEYRNLVNSRCNGESMRSYVLLYENLAEAGVEVPEFIELPKRVASFYLENQLKGDDEGSFGRWWTRAGEPVNTLGTNGAYILSFLIQLEPYFEDKEAIDRAIGKAGAYYGKLVDRGDFFGDTLDADAYDKESGAVLLGMFLDLYERSRERIWLDYAVKTGEHLLGWIWQYDAAFPKDSPLSAAGFRTTGMTSVSVAHHHLDFYGISIGYDFLRLWEHSGDDVFRTNGRMMIDACRQLTRGGNEGVGSGSGGLDCQPEQINHTDWDYFDREDHSKGFFDICISWVTVLGLGAWLNIEKKFPGYFDDDDQYSGGMM